MKIIKDGKPIAELPDLPKNFDGWTRDGQITLVIGDDEVKLARYEDADTANQILKALCDNYLAGAETFSLPTIQRR